MMKPDETARLASMGSRIRMQVHEKRTRRPVFQGWLQPPHWVDATYIDKQALLDPSQSDFPLMQKAVALGMFHPPEIREESYGISYTWLRVAP